MERMGFHMNFGICATPSRPNSKSALNPRDSIVFCKLRRISLQGLVRSAHFLQPGGFGFLFPLLRFDRQQHDDADDEEKAREKIPNRLEPVSCPTSPKTKGPKMEANFPDKPKNPKNSALR